MPLGNLFYPQDLKPLLIKMLRSVWKTCLRFLQAWKQIKPCQCDLETLGSTARFGTCSSHHGLCIVLNWSWLEGDRHAPWAQVQTWTTPKLKFDSGHPHATWHLLWYSLPNNPLLREVKGNTLAIILSHFRWGFSEFHWWARCLKPFTAQTLLFIAKCHFRHSSNVSTAVHSPLYEAFLQGCRNAFTKPLRTSEDHLNRPQS